MDEGRSSVARIKAQALLSSLVLRQSVNLLCGLVYLIQPNHTRIGVTVAAVVSTWAAYRLVSRRVRSTASRVLDYALVLGVAATLQYTLGGMEFVSSNPYALAITGSSVIAHTMELRMRQSALSTLGLIIAFGWGATQLPEIDVIFEVFWVYYFVFQWISVFFMRWIVLRSAGIADEAAAEREATYLVTSVARARRISQREHWATLHDTAAATMMMVDQGVPVPQSRLRRRAERDLNALQTLPDCIWGVDDQNMLDAVARVVGESSLQVTVHAVAEPLVSSAVTVAIIGALREALGNVERHAGVQDAHITIDDGVVTVVDTGAGFDATSSHQSDTAGHGRGLRESITGRMSRVGGRAEIVSALGAGTEVRMYWNDESPTADHVRSTDPALRAARISNGFSTGLIAVAVLFVTVGASAAGTFFDPVQFVLWAVLMAITAVGAFGVLAHRLSTPVKVGCLLVICVVTFLQTTTVSDDIGSTPHWSAGTLGWITLLFVVDLSTGRLSLVLAIVWLPNLLAAAIVGPIGAMTAQALAYTAISNMVVQMIMGGFVVDMRRHARLAASASAASAEASELQTIADELQRDHQHRYVQLAETTIPLLESFVDGSATTDTPGIREKAALESSRLRRLFDEADAANHPLAGDLDMLVNASERRGVAVSVDFDPQLGHLSTLEHQSLFAVCDVMLRSALSLARVVVSASPVVEISITADSPDSVSKTLDAMADAVDIRYDRDGDRLWTQASLKQVARNRSDVGRTTDSTTGTSSTTIRT